MHKKHGAWRLSEVAQPAQHFRVIRMGREMPQDLDLGPHVHHSTMNLYLACPFNEGTATGAFRLITHKQHCVPAVGQAMSEVVQNDPGLPSP